jgi:hypothetical protein
MENSLDIAKLIPLLIPILLIQLALMAAAIIDLIKHPNSRYLPRWAWVLIVIFINIFGPIIYFFIGRKEE